MSTPFHVCTSSSLFPLVGWEFALAEIEAADAIWDKMVNGALYTVWWGARSCATAPRYASLYSNYSKGKGVRPSESAKYPYVKPSDIADPLGGDLMSFGLDKESKFGWPEL